MIHTTLKIYAVTLFRTFSLFFSEGDFSEFEKKRIMNDFFQSIENMMIR